MFGFSERTFSRLVAADVVCPKQRGRGGRPSLFDPLVAIPALIRFTLEHPSSGRNTASAIEARERRERSQADLNELKLAQLRGELLPREQIVREGQAATISWSRQLQQLPARLVMEGLIGRDQEPAARAIVYDALRELAACSSVADVMALQVRSERLLETTGGTV